MVNTNPTVSEINLCLLRVVKLGIMKVKPNMRSRNLEETLTTSPAMIMDKKVAIQETVNAPHIQISKSMQKHSVR